MKQFTKFLRGTFVRPERGHITIFLIALPFASAAMRGVVYLIGPNGLFTQQAAAGYDVRPALGLLVATPVVLLLVSNALRPPNE